MAVHPNTIRATARRLLEGEAAQFCKLEGDARKVVETAQAMLRDQGDPEPGRAYYHEHHYGGFVVRLDDPAPPCGVCGDPTGNPSGFHYECAATSGELARWERGHS